MVMVAPISIDEIYTLSCFWTPHTPSPIPLSRPDVVMPTDGEDNITRKARIVAYGGLAFGVSFLVPFFPLSSWAGSETMMGIHLIVSLFLYDAVFTCVLRLHVTH